MTVSYEQNDKVKAKFKHFMEKHIGMLPAPVFIFELSALILHNLSLPDFGDASPCSRVRLLFLFLLFVEDGLDVEERFNQLLFFSEE